MNLLKVLTSILILFLVSSYGLVSWLRVIFIFLRIFQIIIVYISITNLILTVKNEEETSIDRKLISKNINFKRS